MKIHNIKLGLLVFICCLIQNEIFTQAFSSIESHPEVTLERTETKVLHSDIVGQDYELIISLPYSYAKSDTFLPGKFG